MSEYLEQVLKASGGAAAPAEVLIEEIPEGYHRMPDGTIMKDSEHDDEASLEKGPNDPCWDGYVQVGMKNKKGKRVPNCVPSAATIDYLVDSANSEFGSSRHIAKQSAYAVARKACDKYSNVSDDELYSAVLWEVTNFIEFATIGASDDAEDALAYSDYLQDGHPAIESTLTAAATWLSGAPELDHSGREVILSAFNENGHYVDVLHATSRIKVLVAGGTLSGETLSYVEMLSEKAAQLTQS